MTDVIPSHAEHHLLAAHTSGEQGTYARMLCHRHAAALLTMASMVLDDLDTAGDIVASTIAAGSRDRDPEPSAETPTRMQLARSVYHRCLGHQAFVERFPELNGAHRRGPTAPVDEMTEEQRVILALVVFGGHDVAQAAEFLRKPISTIVGALATNAAQVNGRHMPVHGRYDVGAAARRPALGVHHH